MRRSRANHPTFGHRDHGRRYGLRALFVDLNDRFVPDVRDEEAASAQHLAKVCAAAECYSHPQGCEWLIEHAVIVHFEARDLDVAGLATETLHPVLPISLAQAFQEIGFCCKKRAVYGQDW